MKTKHFTIVLIIISMTACNHKPQMPFILEKDLSHIENDNILKNKREVLNTLFEIDQWYIEKANDIRYKKTWDVPGYTMMGYVEVPDSIRLGYIQDEIIPGVKVSPYLNAGYKEKILERYASLEDPGNLGYLMIEHELALEMSHLMVDYLPNFLLYLERSDEMYGDNNDGDDNIPEIKEEEAIRCYLEMIKTGNNWATLTIDWGIPFSDPPILYSDYLVFSLIKNKNGKWLLSNIQIFDENEEGTLITYY